MIISDKAATGHVPQIVDGGTSEPELGLINTGQCGASIISQFNSRNSGKGVFVIIIIWEKPAVPTIYSIFATVERYMVTVFITYTVVVFVRLQPLGPFIMLFT